MPDPGTLRLMPGSLHCTSSLKALDGPILALSLLVCLHVRICRENVHLEEQVTPTEHILCFGLA